MLIAREAVPKDASRSLRCFANHQDSLDVLWHQHPEYELTLVEGGPVRRLVGAASSDRRGSDCVLLGPHLPHTWQGGADGGYHCTVVQFGLDWVHHAVTALPEASGIRSLLQRAAGGLQIPPRAPWLARLRDLPAKPPMQQVLELIALLDELTAAEDLRPITGAAAIRHPDRRLDDCCAWLQRHCHLPVDQATLARRHGMRPAAFSRWFRRRMGTTCSAYLQDLRIARASQLLLDTRHSIADIAAASGFRTRAHFNSVFKRLRGRTPRSYRAAHR